MDARLTTLLTTSSIAAVLGVGACGDDIPDATSPGATDSTGPSTGSGVDATTTSLPPGDGTSSAETTGTPGDASETGFDPPVPTCGNGYVEEGEQCDDANEDDADDCSNACLVPCGLQASILVPGPTLDSEIEGLRVAPAPDGGTIVAAYLRVITTDQRGNQTLEDRTVLVFRWDARGRLAWEVTLASPDGHVDVAGIAVSEAGDVFVATTEDAADGGRAIVTRRLSGTDGQTVWTEVFEGDLPGGDDVATGLSLSPDGDVVVAGHVRIADGDNDIWVRKLAAGDGAEQWTSTHGGVPNGGFSTDTGGPVAVAPDGEVYVVGRIYVDFQTVEARLLRFDGDGTGLVWELPPDLPGADQQWSALDVSVGDDGSIVYAFERVVGVDLDFHVRKVDADANIEWALDRDAFAGEGSDWRLSGLGHSGDELVVGGSRTNDFTIGRTAWTDVWVARVDAGGMTRCQVEHTAEGRGLVPPSVIAQGVSAGADASGLLTGRLVSEGVAAIWLGRFRSQ